MFHSPIMTWSRKKEAKEVQNYDDGNEIIDSWHFPFFLIWQYDLLYLLHALLCFCFFRKFGNLQEIAIASERVGIVGFSFLSVSFLLLLLLRLHHALQGVSLVTYSTGMDVGRFGQEGNQSRHTIPTQGKARHEKEIDILVDLAISSQYQHMKWTDGKRWEGWIGILSLG